MKSSWKTTCFDFMIQHNAPTPASKPELGRHYFYPLATKIFGVANFGFANSGLPCCVGSASSAKILLRASSRNALYTFWRICQPSRRIRVTRKTRFYQQPAAHLQNVRLAGGDDLLHLFRITLTADGGHGQPRVPTRSNRSAAWAQRYL